MAAVLPLLVATSAGRSTGERPTHPTALVCGRFTGFSGRPFAIHVTRDGSVLITAQDVDRVVRLDSRDTLRAYLGVGEDPGEVISNRDGTIAYISGFQDGTIAILDVLAGSVVDVVQLPTRNAYRLALSPAESRLYITSTDGRLYVMDAYDRTVSRTKLLGGSLQGLAVDRAGNLFVSSTAGDIWRLGRSLGTTAQTTIEGCTAQDVALSIDDAELYVACEQGSVVVLDPRTLDTISVIRVPTGSAFDLAVTPDNAQLYVSSPSAGHITILDRVSRAVVYNIRANGIPRRIAFSPHGEKAYVTNEWNWVNIIK